MPRKPIFGQHYLKEIRKAAQLRPSLPSLPSFDELRDRFAAMNE